MKKAILIIAILVCTGIVLVMLGRSARESGKMRWKARRPAPVQTEKAPAAQEQEAAQIVPGDMPVFTRNAPVSDAAQQLLQVPAQWRAQFMEVPPYKARLISAGDFVDILFTFEATMRDGKKETVTATLLQKVQVLASGVEGGTGWLALAVDPRDAQYLSLAFKEGSVEAVVRNRTDSLVSPLKIASMSSLFN